MLKDSQSPRYPVPRTRRTYTPQFKAELLTACKQPGASIAALAACLLYSGNLPTDCLQAYHRKRVHYYFHSNEPISDLVPER